MFRLDLKKLIASTGRQKILKELSKRKEMRVMQLVQKLGSPYNEVNRNLKILETEGIIKNYYPKQVKHSSVRIITLNDCSDRTQKLLKALRDLDEEKGPVINC
jgi:predicted transcriptional regulator